MEQKFKIGDSVRHKNTANHIYTISSITGNYVATINRPKELWVKLNPNSKSSPIIKESVCLIDNLIKI